MYAGSVSLAEILSRQRPNLMYVSRQLLGQNYVIVIAFIHFGVIASNSAKLTLC